MTMKFAIQNLLSWRDWQSHAEVYANSLEECRLADELGFDAVWLAEHHFSPYGICANLAVFGAAVARETKRARIGTAVVIAPFAHPLRIAEEYAMLDILSGGRLDFGIGRGYQPKEFQGLSVSMEKTRERFDESLELIRRAWMEERASTASSTRCRTWRCCPSRCSARTRRCGRRRCHPTRMPWRAGEGCAS
jgi:alkanesulfonate monooxygenase SsuD/methylene tetrahydromethanopterin reductase-like flavin-dependent oxidoreductase (luciferase family)